MTEIVIRDAAGADILGMFRTVTMDYGQMRLMFGSRLDRR